MKKTNIIALGFTTFSLFLGAGNVIFPAMIGQLAGHNTMMAGLGFILGDLGLTLLALTVIAFIGGPDKLLQDFPQVFQKGFWTLLFIIIGPAFVIPRAAMVTYEIGFSPFVGKDQTIFYVYAFSFSFIAMLLTLNPKRIVSTVGKWMTPVLLLLLIIISVATVTNPQGHIEMAQANYQYQPFSEGLIQGYLTMDVLGALGFGWILTAAIKNLGVKYQRGIALYTLTSGLMATVGMALVYSALLYLGATSTVIAPHAANGGYILTSYVDTLFGPSGIIMLAVIVTLACLTTCIGVAAAGAEYFHKVQPKNSYRTYVVFIFMCSAIVTTVGLNKLIGFTIPVIVSFYPLTIAIVITAFLRRWLSSPKVVTYTFCSTALFFGIIDGIMSAGFLPKAIAQELNNYLPFFHQGMGWIAPGFTALIISIALTQYRYTRANLA